MSHFLTWASLTVGIFIYRMFTNTTISFEEHIAGIYFSGVGLFSHWLAGKINSNGEGAG